MSKPLRVWTWEHSADFETFLAVGVGYDIEEAIAQVNSQRYPPFNFDGVVMLILDERIYPYEFTAPGATVASHSG